MVNHSPNLSYNSNNIEVSVAKISSYVTLHNTYVQGSFNGAPHDQKCDNIPFAIYWAEIFFSNRLLFS